MDKSHVCWHHSKFIQILYIDLNRLNPEMLVIHVPHETDTMGLPGPTESFWVSLSQCWRGPGPAAGLGGETKSGVCSRQIFLIRIQVSTMFYVQSFAIKNAYIRIISYLYLHMSCMSCALMDQLGIINSSVESSVNSDVHWVVWSIDRVSFPRGTFDSYVTYLWILMAKYTLGLAMWMITNVNRWKHSVSRKISPGLVLVETQW